MKYLFLFMGSVMLTIYFTACRGKTNTNSTTSNTSWHNSEGELHVGDTSLAITVYHREAFDNGILNIEAPFTQGQFELTVPYASIYTFTLPNRTTVYLNSGSKLRFDLTSTIMKLDGEALVNAHDTLATVYSGSHEFVHGQRGAIFNISSYSDYPGENLEALLVQGSVIMNSRNFRDTLSEAGETLVCDKSTLERVALRSNVMEVMSWTKAGLEYSNIPVKQLLRKLGRRYGVSISGEENIENNKVSFKGKDTWSLKENLAVISNQNHNYAYAIGKKELKVYDLARIMGGAHAAYYRTLLE